jgi:hypothetical protein
MPKQSRAIRGDGPGQAVKPSIFIEVLLLDSAKLQMIMPTALVSTDYRGF